MRMTRVGRGILATALTVVLSVLLGGSLWLRICGLGAMPEVNGDEAFYGLVAGRAVMGRKVPLLTSSGNIPDPFMPLMLAPLIALFGPKFWVLRLPCLISSVLAVVAAFVLGRRLFDHPTAMVLAVLIAVLPPCVLYGGIGSEHSQSPLFGLLAISCAFRAKPVRLLLAFLACFLVHPTNALLFPILAGVFTASAWKRCESAESRRRLLLGVVGLSLLVVATIGAYAAWRGVFGAGHQGGSLGRDLDWGRFLTGFARLFTGGSSLLERPTAAFLIRRDVGFWVIVALILLAIPRWLADRAWDRLALVGGLVVGVAGLHVLAGPGVLDVGTMRYGIVFVAPMAIAVALAIAPMVRVRTADGRPRLRLLAVAPLLGLAFVPLWDVCQYSLAHYARQGGGSLQAPWAVHGPLERAFDRIVAELDAEADSSDPGEGTRPIIVGQNWWFQKPLEYLALDHPEIRVVSYGRLGGNEVVRYGWLNHLMNERAFVVGVWKQGLDAMASIPVGTGLPRRWVIFYARHPALTVIRRDPPEAEREPALAIAPGTKRK